MRKQNLCTYRIRSDTNGWQKQEKSQQRHRVDRCVLVKLKYQWREKEASKTQLLLRVIEQLWMPKGFPVPRLHSRLCEAKLFLYSHRAWLCEIPIPLFFLMCYFFEPLLLEIFKESSISCKIVWKIIENHKRASYFHFRKKALGPVWKIN